MIHQSINQSQVARCPAGLSGKGLPVSTVFPRFCHVPTGLSHVSTTTPFQPFPSHCTAGPGLAWVLRHGQRIGGKQDGMGLNPFQGHGFPSVPFSQAGRWLPRVPFQGLRMAERFVQRTRGTRDEHPTPSARPLRRRSACAGRPPSRGLPSHLGNRGATAARARAGRGRGEAGGGVRTRAAAAALAAGSCRGARFRRGRLPSASSHCSLTRFRYRQAASGHGLPESKRESGAWVPRSGRRWAGCPG